MRKVRVFESRVSCPTLLTAITLHPGLPCPSRIVLTSHSHTPQKIHTRRTEARQQRFGGAHPDRIPRVGALAPHAHHCCGAPPRPPPCGLRRGTLTRQCSGCRATVLCARGWVRAAARAVVTPSQGPPKLPPPGRALPPPRRPHHYWDIRPHNRRGGCVEGRRAVGRFFLQ